MEKTRLLNQLEQIAAKISVEYVPELGVLINELKAEIYAESNGVINKSLLQRTKAALRFLKHVSKVRPVLQYCDYQNIAGIDYQVFTDGYTMFMLVDRMELPYYKDNMPNASYPSLSGIYNGCGYTDITESIDINDIMAKLKAKMLPIQDKMAKYVNENVNTYDDIVKIGFDANRLKSIVDILGTTELNVYYKRELAPLLFVDEVTGNKAMLCTIRLGKER